MALHRTPKHLVVMASSDILVISTKAKPGEGTTTTVYSNIHSSTITMYEAQRPTSLGVSIKGSLLLRGSILLISTSIQRSLMLFVFICSRQHLVHLVRPRLSFNLLPDDDQDPLLPPSTKTSASSLNYHLYSEPSPQIPSHIRERRLLQTRREPKLKRHAFYLYHLCSSRILSATRFQVRPNTLRRRCRRVDQPERERVIGWAGEDTSRRYASLGWKTGRCGRSTNSKGGHERPGTTDLRRVSYQKDFQLVLCFKSAD